MCIDADRFGFSPLRSLERSVDPPAKRLLATCLGLLPHASWRALEKRCIAILDWLRLDRSTPLSAEDVVRATRFANTYCGCRKIQSRRRP